MRSFQPLDDLLENAVAAALGLTPPHPDAPRKRRATRARSTRRPPHTTPRPRRERRPVAA